MQNVRQSRDRTEEICSADTVSCILVVDTGHWSRRSWRHGVRWSHCQWSRDTAGVKSCRETSPNQLDTRYPVIITSDQLTYPGVALHSDAAAQATLCYSSITLWLLGFSLASSRTVSAGLGSTWKLPSLSDLEFGLFCGRFEIPTVRIIVIKLTQRGS